MTYVSRHVPWKHQREALDRMAGREAFALLMAMRTGKTKTLLDDWGRMVTNGDCDDLLVIAPGGVYRTWEKAVDDHLPESLRTRVLVHTWKAGANSQGAKRELEAFLLVEDQPRILLINIEALSNVERARALCLEFAEQRRCMVAIDESTAIKNPSAKRTKFILRELKPRANWRRILSGLPTPKSPLDLYSQFDFLDSSILGFKTFAGFKARYAITKLIPVGGRNIPIVVGFRPETNSELGEYIAQHSCRVLLEDCYDLPPKMYSVREVEMTDEQRTIYNEIKEFATASLGDSGHVTATQVITQILRLHQVLCGHVGNEEGEFVEIPEHRTRSLIDLLAEHDGKGIIWCSYDADVRKVSAAIEKEFGPTARFWGGNRTTREEEEHRFLNDPECRYIVATAAAGGRGRTWTVADLVVYYSNTADLEHRSQSEERAQGVDKIRSVSYVDLVVPGTVDEKMLKTLRRKITMAAAIHGDNWREWVV